jgi:hypothetical protein
MKRFFVLLIAISIMLLPVSTAFADGGAPPPVLPDGSTAITIQRVVTNQKVANNHASSNNSGHPGGPTPDASTNRNVGSWTITYANAAALGYDGNGNKYVQHYYGKTIKTAGSGSYQAEVHATLLNGGTYDSPSVFDYITNPCAKSVVNNGTAQSCSSPWFASSTGRQWYIITGHYFDIGIDGTKDSTCDGCIDWVYATP